MLSQSVSFWELFIALYFILLNSILAFISFISLGQVASQCVALMTNVFQDIMMNLAKAVANAAAMMVLKAKNVAQVAEDMALQNRVITAATQCALSTSQLVACTKVLFRVCRGVNAADNLYILLINF